MSTSRGEPSKKIKWLRSMIDKIAHENKLLELEKKKNSKDNPKHSKKPQPAKQENV